MTYVNIDVDDIIKNKNSDFITQLMPIVVNNTTGNGAISIYKKLNKIFGNENHEINTYKDQLLKSAIKSFKFYGNYDISYLLSFMKRISGDSEEDTILKGVLLDVLKDYTKIPSWQRIQFYRHISKVVETEKERIDLLNAFHEYISIKELKNQLSKIDGGFNNAKLSFKNKSKFKLLHYSAKDLKTRKTKLEITRLITKQNTLLKYLPCDIVLNKDDIEAMAPMARLDFLEWYYNEHINAAAAKNFSSLNDMKKKIRYSRMNSNKTKVKLTKDLKSEDIEKMLFATAIKKHERVSKFIEKFKEYERMFDKNIVFVKASSSHW